MENQDYVQLPNDNNHFSSTSILQKTIKTISFSYFDLNKKYNQIASHTGYKPNASLIIGKRGVGKTVLTKDIINNLNKIHNFDKTVLFTYDKSKCEFNNVNIVDEYSSATLKNIIEQQKNIDSKPVLLIFNDCIYSNKINNDDNFKQILINGRHLKLYSIVIIQYPLGFKPEIRINFDFIYFFKDEYIANCRRAYDHYFGILPSYSDFDTFIKSLVDYESIVLDNFNNSLKITDRLGFYKSNYIN